MPAIASLSLNLGVDLKGWTAGLKAAGGAVTKFYGGVSTLASKGASALSPLAGAAGGAALGLIGIASAAGAAGVALASAGLDRIDALTDSAQRLGVTTEALSQLRYAANLTGSSAEDLDGALEKLSANLGDSAAKATPTSEALARLGLDAKQLANGNPGDAFKAIVKGFESIPNASEKASLAMDIFGKGGIKILNTLGAGGKQLDDLAEEAKRFGVSVSQVDAAKIGAAKDSLDRAGAAVEGIGNTLAIELAPLIETVAGAFAEWTADTVQGGGLVAQAFDLVAKSLGTIGDLGFSAEKATQSFLAGAIEKSGSVLDFFGGNGQGARDIAKTFREDIERGFDVKPSERLGAFLADIKTKAKYAAEETAKIAGENLGAGTRLDSLGKSIADVTKKLKDQADTFGMTAAEADIYKLAQQGATEAQLKDARAQAQRSKDLEQDKKDYEELKGFAKGYWESTLTASEKYGNELDRINAALDAGLIDQDTANRATKKAGKESGLNETKLAGAVELGSSGAYSAITSALSGRDGMADVAKSSSKTATNTGMMASGIANLVKILGKQEPAMNI